MEAEVIFSHGLHLLIFANQQTHRQQDTCVRAVSPEFLVCSPQGKKQQLLSPQYVFWVPLAQQWQVGVCADILSLCLGAKQLLQWGLFWVSTSLTSSSINHRQGCWALPLVAASRCGYHLPFNLEEESMCKVTYSLCQKLVHWTSSKIITKESQQDED